MEENKVTNYEEQEAPYGRCRICKKPCPFDHDVPEEEIVCDVCAGAPEDEVDW